MNSISLDDPRLKCLKDLGVTAAHCRCCDEGRAIMMAVMMSQILADEDHMKLVKALNVNKMPPPGIQCDG